MIQSAFCGSSMVQCVNLVLTKGKSFKRHKITGGIHLDSGGCHLVWYQSVTHDPDCFCGTSTVQRVILPFQKGINF